MKEVKMRIYAMRNKQEIKVVSPEMVKGLKMEEAAVQIIKAPFGKFMICDIGIQ